MKFQKPSMHGSNVMLVCTQKRDKRTNGRADKAQSNMPSNFFEVGSRNMKSQVICLAYYLRQTLNL